ncbi:Calmodulin-like protein 3 [Monoraphidium neglectum]|uniref:Caltractin n=1 Tax=Monoraphidium neglectum TaxID=145388 RepID=A0A0D2N840_9CHLO|nr:Calmodulin-like protein 3 [Monoraphidium neglectum]KIZ01961.1 Calmodulin-like protein 3 [Monoraphidium neglectum]|eukprot:XP_013900980.1 Calmodulin-like protein 3 [Monoraphidium neglectum]
MYLLHMQGSTAPQLSREEIGELRELFDMLDTDKGGTLSASEVRALMRMLGMRVSAAEARVLVAGVDADGSGALDFDEFLQVVAAPQQKPAYMQGELVHAFRRFADRSVPAGCIAPETLERALASGVEPVEISRMVHSLDTNADGLINFREMVALLFSGQQQQQQQQQ